MFRKLIIILFFAPFTYIYGQRTDFSSMKAQMTDQSLPLVNLTYDADKLNKYNFIEGTIEIVDKQMRTESGKESVTYSADFRIRGASAAGLKKKSLAIKLFKIKDGEKEDLDISIFGIRKENSWILDAMGFDRIRMRIRTCFDLWNEMSSTPYDTKYGNRNGTKGEFVEVFVNGIYNGLYCMSDKIDRKLLDVTKYNKKVDESEAVHGLIYKGVKWESGIRLLNYDSSASPNSTTWCGWELEYPDDYPSYYTWQPLKELIKFCASSTSDNDFRANYNDYFYTSNLVDYMVMTMALNVNDNLYKNTFLSVQDINNRHRYMISPWDMDDSFGGKYNGDRRDELSDVTRYNSTAPYNRLYRKNIDGFADQVKKRWLALQNTVFSIEHVHSALDAYAAKFVSSGAWQREYKKWNGANSIPLTEDLSSELSYVKDWYVRNFTNLCNKWGWRGDVNGDNKVDMNDVNLLSDIIMEKTTDYEFYKADVNGDTFINATDIVEVISSIKP